MLRIEFSGEFLQILSQKFAHNLHLSTIVDCSWEYILNPQIDFCNTWNTVEQSILRNFAGDLDEGIPSPSVQNTIYITEKDVLEKVKDIKSIKMTLPVNKLFNNIF